MISKSGILNTADLEAANSRMDNLQSKLIVKQSQVQSQIQNAAIDSTDYPALIEKLEAKLEGLVFQFEAETDLQAKARLTAEIADARGEQAAAEAHLRNYDKYSMIERQVALAACARNIRDILDYLAELEAMRPTLAAA